jgi:hypothetical protein
VALIRASEKREFSQTGGLKPKKELLEGHGVTKREREKQKNLRTETKTRIN